MRQWWRDHSLTIILATVGTLTVAFAWLLPEGRIFDTVLGLGQGILTGGLVFLLQGRFREVSKPED